VKLEHTVEVVVVAEEVESTEVGLEGDLGINNK
jgi:hypothetical protein